MAQGFPVDESDWTREKENLKKEVLAVIHEKEEGERDMAAVPGRHDLDVHGLTGVIGVLADLGVVDRIPDYDAKDIRNCIAWAFRGHHTNLLFRSSAHLDEFDKLSEESVTRRRIRRIYAAETLMEGAKNKKPSNVEGCIGYAQDLVIVNDSLITEENDVTAARKFLNIIFNGLLIFAQYSHAVKFQKAMIMQKKRIPRLVGLDRPFDIIDSDGGRSVVAQSNAQRELAQCAVLGIVAFGSSSRGKEVKSRGEVAAKRCVCVFVCVSAMFMYVCA